MSDNKNISIENLVISGVNEIKINNPQNVSMHNINEYGINLTLSAYSDIDSNPMAHYID